ncbi:MAG: hypoxanthine phosphoribosyltransferase [Deltaproteobacteria bacterium]|nr:hypoxanthine phosphoribosyltransferase [Deltaproteobacteria bacterium]
MLKHHVLFDEATIGARVARLADAIRHDLPNSTPVIIGLLTGSFVFLADLVRSLARLGVEPQIDFIAASHYRDTVEPSGVVQIRKDTSIDLSGRPVILVDDILDSGHTLYQVREHLTSKGSTWLRTCVFLDKPSRRSVDIKADYVGFEVPDIWIIGYGLDAKGQGRALPYIAVVENE